jgi:hypothetical protein
MPHPDLARLGDIALARIARWHPPTAAKIVVAAGLLMHEVAYHLAGGTEFPLTVLASDTRILVISHGGLDALAVGTLAIATIAVIDAARQHLARSR